MKKKTVLVLTCFILVSTSFRVCFSSHYGYTDAALLASLVLTVSVLIFFFTNSHNHHNEVEAQLWSQTDWLQVLILLLIGCLTLCKSVYLF